MRVSLFTRSELLDVSVLSSLIINRVTPNGRVSDEGDGEGEGDGENEGDGEGEGGGRRQPQQMDFIL
jgi:hypothetical protein